MVVRSPVRSPVRSVVQSVFGEAEAFNPFQLFSSGAQGAWYDPSDFSTLYQDSTGTTPVTAVEQPVGLMLDRSKGLVLGSELVTNGGFDDATGWTVGADWSIVGGTANYNNVGAAQALSQTITLTAGRAYVITYTVSALSSGFVYARLVGSATTNGVTRTANGAFTEIIIAPASPTTLGFVAQGVFSIDNISVRELPGNHAFQSSSASRPILRSRYNLLTRTEEFDNAAWTAGTVTVNANAGVAPDGTATADNVVPTVSSGAHNFYVTFTFLSGSYTLSVFAKASGYNWIKLGSMFSGNGVFFDVLNGTIGTANAGYVGAIQNVGGGWFRCSVTWTASAGSDLPGLYVATSGSTVSYTGDGTSGIYVWGASLLTAADAEATGNAYQRVGAATDYDTGPPWRPYLAFDGSDDSMATSSIDFSGTDKMTVFAGVHKASDAAFGILAELSATSASNNGAIAIFAPFDAAQQNYGARSKGTASAQASGPASSAGALPAPNTSVLTMLADISAPSLSLAVNGAAYASSVSTQGTGNYGNYPLFIGRRNNTSFPFNGRLYGLTVLGRTATPAELTSMESWVAGKTGVSL